jgi:hypothetical protein
MALPFLISPLLPFCDQHVHTHAHACICIGRSPQRACFFINIFFKLFEILPLIFHEFLHFRWRIPIVEEGKFLFFFFGIPPVGLCRPHGIECRFIIYHRSRQVAQPTRHLPARRRNNLHRPICLDRPQINENAVRLERSSNFIQSMDHALVFHSSE